MTTYSGPATLILADGTRVAGTAALQSRVSGTGMQSWRGRFQAHDSTADVFNAVGGTLPLELPGGATGTVLVQNLDNVVSPRPALTLVGSGPVPF